MKVVDVDHYGNIVKYSYDTLGRKITAIDPDQGQKSYVYDLVGNLIQQIDARGVVTKFTFDSLNRPLQVVYPKDKGVQYTYDQGTIGTLSQVTDALGTVAYKYDSRLRQVQEDRTMDGMTWTTKWAYDAMDRVASQTYPDGNTVSFAYNTMGELNGIATILNSIDYNERGQEIQRDYVNALSTKFDYTPTNQRLKTITTAGVQDYSYGYDSTGNVQAIVTNASDPTNKRTESFTYDDLDRLVNAQDPGTNGYNNTYAYNAIGNMLSETDMNNGVSSIATYTYGLGGAGPHAVTGKSDTKPLIGLFSLNGGKAYSTTQTVTLNNIALGSPTEYIASQKADFSDASWKPYSTNPSFVLSSGFGAKTVYFKVRNQPNVETSVVSGDIQYLLDSKGSGIPDIYNPDLDNDGIPDAWERANGVDMTVPGHANLDPDHDGLTNLQEYLHGTNPNSADSDNDGWSDSVEIANGTNPNSNGFDNVHDSVSANYTLQLGRFNQGGGIRTGTTYSATDTLGKAISVNALPDGDGDGIPDILDSDSDNDGIPDAWERANGISLTVPGHAQLDPDHDGLTNLQEYLHGTNPNKADTDGDGLSDYKEIYVDHSDPNAINTFQPAVSENYSLVSAGFNMGGNSRSGTTTIISDRVGSQWNGNVLNNNCNAAVTPTMIDYGVVDANGQVSQITVANQGNGNLIIGVISIDGENGLEFTTQNDTCSNQTIAPHGSCTVSVRFMPAFAGAKGALLHVPTSDHLASNLSVSLSGIAGATVIDQTPPSGGIVRINSGASITNSEQVTLTLSAQDASGVAGMCISNSNVCSNWEPFAAGKAWALPESDGTYTVYVWFRDSVGNSNVTPYTATITLDTVIPTMSASVQGGMYKNAQTVALTSSKPGTSYYTLDGTNPTKGSSVYSTPLQLTTNAELKFFAVDRAGNQSEIGAEVYTIGIVSPTLTISTVADGSTTNNATLNISGTVTDPTGVTSLTINSASVTIGAGGSFSSVVTLKPGANTIISIAVDALGNQTTDTRTVTLDQTAPILTVTTPADNSKTSQALTTVHGTINETSSVVIKVNNGSMQQAAITGNSFDLGVTLAAGINTINITAADLASNTSSAVRTVTYDNSSPSLAITNPGQDITTALNSLTLSGTVSDAQTSVAVTIVFNGKTYTPTVTNGAFSQPLTFPAEGTYSVVATATDEVGNSVSVTRNIIYALPAPNVAITSPTTPTTSVNQMITGTMDSGATVAVTCSTASIGTVSYPTATTWQVTISNMASGNNTVTATAVNSQGKVSSPATMTIFVNIADTIPPTISAFVMPTMASTTTVPLTSLIATDNVGVTGYYLSETNFAPIASANGWSITTPQNFIFAGTGAKILYAWVKDAAGNVSAAASASVIIGGSADTAHDGIINSTSGKTTPDIGDALTALRYVVGLNPLNATQLANADVAPLGPNGHPLGNGTVDIADVIMILRRVIGVGSW